MHQFKTVQFLPIDNKKAWDFFSSPKNLSVITPPELDFQILTQLNDQAIFEGMKIDYTVKPLLGITIAWQTEICKVRNQEYFTDKQTKGPYKVWEHTHSFKVENNGVIMTDVVNYELPFGFLGKLAEWLLVRKKIKSIFNFRKTVLEKIFI